MSRSTLENVLELLINEEREAAEAMLHDFIVAEARRIHEELLNESDEVVEEDLEDIDESEDETVEEEEDLPEDEEFSTNFQVREFTYRKFRKILVHLKLITKITI